MRLMTPNSIPVFLGNAGIGLLHGILPPQIRGFDVYYKFPVVVGFHIIGSPESEFNVQEIFSAQEIEDNSPKITGFYCFASQASCGNVLPDFIANAALEENSAQVLGFYAIAVSEISGDNIKLMAQMSEEENSPQIIGFYGIGVT